jgi:hypothetical protein
MKILAINPPVEDFTAYNLWAVPLGLLRIIEQLRNDGHTVEYVDLLDGKGIGDPSATPPVFRSWGRHSYWKKEIEKPQSVSFVPRNYYRFGAVDQRSEEILSSCQVPDKILISTGMTYWYQAVIKTVGIVKKIFPGKQIVLGGISATLIPGFFDIENVEVIKGKYFAGNEITAIPEDISSSLHFFPVNLVEGCPNRCTYCSSYLLNPQIKIKDIDYQAETLERWSLDTGLFDVAFYDDALLLNKGFYLKKFLKKLEPGKYRFHTPNGLHLKEIDDELCILLKDYNFMQLRFGFETFSRKYDDKTSSDQLKKVVEKLLKAGFTRKQIGVYLLCGLPGQNVEDVDDTIDFVSKTGAKPYLNEYSPVPFTKLFEKHKLESLLDIECEPLYHNNTLSAWRSPVFKKESITELKKKLDFLYKKAFL